MSFHIGRREGKILDALTNPESWTKLGHFYFFLIAKRVEFRPKPKKRGSSGVSHPMSFEPSDIVHNPYPCVSGEWVIFKS